jgi:hypothetical protein
MRPRIIFLLVALSAVLAIPAVGTTAPGDQVRGPGCGDITFWNSDQTGPPQYSTGNPQGSTPATVYGTITTAKPSCSGFVYTISVYADATQQATLTTQTFNGDDATSLFSFTYSPPGAPSQVCVATTSMRDGHLVDAAPDTGCAILVLDGGIGGGSGLN